MSKKHERYYFPLLVALICAAGLVATSLLGMGQGQAQTPKAKPAAAFVGSETCTECHEEPHEQLTKSPHGLAMIAAEQAGRGRLCEGCHGPGSFHAEDPSAETAAPLKKNARTGEGCFQCHDKKLSHTDWKRAEHQRHGVGCMECHGETRTLTSPPKVVKGAQAAKATEPAPFNHAAFTRKPSADACLSCHNSQRAEFAMPSHHPVQEGRIGCADCHDPHKPMTERAKREVCITCHAKQRGPHLYAHGAITSRLTDSCLDCHRPHGAPNEDLLKFKNRGLCLQCHADKVAHFAGRNCIDCHQAVHGSNSNRLLFRE